MQFYGIGIDASSAIRVEGIAKRNPRFRELFVSYRSKSIDEINNLSNFSIIEALFKALRCPTYFPLQEISIVRQNNAPKILLSGTLGKSWKHLTFSVSVTHHEDLIIAVVVAFSEKGYEL